MPPARTTAARSAALPRRGGAPRGRQQQQATRPGGGVHWDRVGRLALVAVAILIVALYVGPIISLFETSRESGQRNQELQQLQQRNTQLKKRKDALNDPATLEREARRLGKVRPGERPYVIEGLPK
jgi:cell division protein FtsB